MAGARGRGRGGRHAEQARCRASASCGNGSTARTWRPSWTCRTRRSRSALAGLTREKNRVALLSSPGTSELTGRACGPNHIQWTHDTYGIPSAVTRAVVARGGTSWFFITPNYTLRHRARGGLAPLRGGGGRDGAGRHALPLPRDRRISRPICCRRRRAARKVIGLSMSGRGRGQLHEAGDRVRHRASAAARSSRGWRS